jgi:hypothetical protein
MYFEDGNLFIETQDQCYTCKHLKGKKLCPLIDAISAGVVALSDDICVNDCGLYAATSRHLKIVKETAQSLLQDAEIRHIN